MSMTKLVIVDLHVKVLQHFHMLTSLDLCGHGREDTNALAVENTLQLHFYQW